MRKLKKTGLWIGAILISIALFRGPLYRLLVHYQTVSGRAAYAIENERLKAELSSWAERHPAATSQQVIDFAQQMTVRNLSFSFGSCSADPNRTFLTYRANCVGYAAFLTASITFLDARLGWNGRLSAKQEAAKLDLLGLDLHQYSRESFFKDHDYVRVTDRLNQKQWALDAVVADYLYIECVNNQ